MPGAACRGTAGSVTFTVQVKDETRATDTETFTIDIPRPRRENTIFGTPTTAGTFTFTVRVTDDLGACSEKEFSITADDIAARAVATAPGPPDAAAEPAPPASLAG
jgi:Putative Ig domain